jgi:carbohydrate kinase (thermoresistant glucokinase family)
MICIVIGVSGSGKTTIGRLLARSLGVPFYDADDFHSAANIAKMSSGTPLTDEDRHDWLNALAAGLSAWEGAGGAVLACSALKEPYREKLQAAVAKPVVWIVLEGEKALLAARLKARTGHYMDERLLDSQLATFETPSYGLHLPLRDGDTPDQLVRRIIEYIKAEKPENSTDGH